MASTSRLRVDAGIFESPVTGAQALAYAGWVGLSGGQAQRVALARAMVTDPAVVFADEPTGSSDSARARRPGTRSGRPCHGTTLVIAATHDRDLTAWTDRTIQLFDGLAMSSTSDDDGDVRPAPYTSGGDRG